MQHSWYKRLYQYLFKPSPYHLLTSHKRALPDFIVIGAMRSGTTSLHRLLVEHPVVVPALKKEIHFFDLHFSKGLRWYRAHYPLAGSLQRRPRASHPASITGEASPYYMFHPQASRRAAATVPHAKLLAILRNPVDRAYSHYWHGVRYGYESRTFEEALAQEPARLTGECEKLLANETYHSRSHQLHSYRARGVYADQLADWLQHFPREQLLVLSNEQFATDPAGQARRVFGFLGLPPEAVRPRKQYNKASYADMSPRTRQQLIEYFRPHNARLYELLEERFGWEG